MASRNEYVDFSDTRIAFASKSPLQLKKALWLFRIMNNSTLVEFFTFLGEWAIRLRLPLSRWLVKKTIFDQFVGGENLKESLAAIEKLWNSKILTVLDYGAEGKSSDEELDKARDQFEKAIEFAAEAQGVPVVSIKISALAENNLLEKVQEGTILTESEENAYRRVRERVESLCRYGKEKGIKIFIDAEESWIQEPIDQITEEMMETYNRGGVIVYQTFQMYRTDRLEYLKRLFDQSKVKGYVLGAKLVRGAYMEKERERARSLGYPSPIHENKKATDEAFDQGVIFCVDRYLEMASCAATHNMDSCLLQAKLIGDRGLPRNHPHLNFCQLYGMSDHITFNLAANGFTAAKYVVFGKVEEVVPYLSRRAKENTAARGEFGREYSLLLQEARRRKAN